MYDERSRSQNLYNPYKKDLAKIIFLPFGCIITASNYIDGLGANLGYLVLLD